MLVIGEEPLSPLVANLARHSMLGEEARSALLDLSYELTTRRRGAILVGVGQSSGYLEVLLSGFAYCYKQERDGLRQVTSLHVRGDVLCAHDVLLGPSDFTAEALTEVILARIGQRDLLALAKSDANIAEALMRDVMINARISREWLLSIGRRTAMQRVAHLICELASRQRAAGLSHGPDYLLPMSQEQMGDMLGLTGVHVSRTFRRLREERLIENRRNSIHMLDWDGLSRLAGFSPEYLIQSAIKRGAAEDMPRTR